MSEHIIDIIEIGKIEKHENADTLGIVRIHGFQACVKLGQFKDYDRAIYIEPDYMIPLARPEFAFLKKEGETKEKHRIKVQKLRGVISQGLLINVPDQLKHLPTGTNVINELGIERYEPPMKGQSGNKKLAAGAGNAKAPPGVYPKYDVENYRRYNHAIEAGEEVVITEKLHGCNARFICINGEMHCSSREHWKKPYLEFKRKLSLTRWQKIWYTILFRRKYTIETQRNLWWQVLDQNPSIEKFCRANPNHTLYGEAFGNVQDLMYGASQDQLFFAGFDVWHDNSWMDYDEVQKLPFANEVTWVPLLHRGPFDEKIAIEMAEGDSSWPGAKHLREGVVVKPIRERFHHKLGRVCLKIVGNRYLSRKDA